MENETPPEFARHLPIPVEMDRVLSPTVTYTGSRAYMAHDTEQDTEDGQPIRVILNHLDALRVCRGEHLPYPREDTIVDNSRWQRERYAYEAKHYSDCYEWGDDVSTMLTTMRHYLFCFHDEFVEAIADGFTLEYLNSSGNKVRWTYPSLS